MLSKEVRELIVKADASGRSRKDIAEIFGVDRSTVSRLSKQMRETGSVELRTHERGRKRTLSDTDLQNIDVLIQNQPDITMEEIREQLNLTVCIETIRKAVIKHLGYTYKKKSLHAWERGRPRCGAQTAGMDGGSVEAGQGSSGVPG